MKKPKRKAIPVQCTGEAHSNAFIDNCGECAPYWGRYFTCPSCTIKLDPKGVCRNEDCLSYRERFDVT